MAYNSASELEKLLSNCEFENHQYVKLIEHEDQLIEALKKEIEYKEDEKKRIQDAVSQLDVDTKQNHKQYTLNRDNLDSLKKTNHVLTEHVAAMNSKMDILQHKTQAERQEHNCHLQKYKDIWETYHDKYESLPLAKELKKHTMMTEEISQTNQEKEKVIQCTKQKIEQIQGKSEISKMGINKFIITLAQMRVGTLHMMREVDMRRTELSQLRQAIQDNQQAASDRTNETNLQKLTDMHLVDKEHSKDDSVSVSNFDLQEQLYPQSPIISMFGDRCDDMEDMQTDASPDQIHLQFVEGQAAAKSSTETSDKQETESKGIAVNEKALPETEAQVTTNSEVINASVDNRGPADAQQPRSNHGNKARHTQVIDQDTQLPFVAYKAKEPESVHIHLDKSANSVQQQQQLQQQQHQQSAVHGPTGQKPVINQRPANMIENDRNNSRSHFPGYKPYIPKLQVRQPMASMKPATTNLRPVVRQVRPTVAQLQLGRPGGFGSSLTRPQQLETSKPFQTMTSPSIPLNSRHVGASSRLTVLQSPRTPKLLQKQESLPIRMPGVSGSNVTPKLTQPADTVIKVARSPLQLTTPPVRHQSPQVYKQSPLQLPSQYQQLLQQKARPQTSLPSTSAVGRDMQKKLVEQSQTSPREIGQKQSPTANTIKREVSPRKFSQTQDAPVTKPATSVHNIPQIGVKIPQPDGTSTYYMKVKDAPETPKFSKASSSPVKSLGDHGTPPEAKKTDSLAEETFSPFDPEKHRKKLADMKKSPAHPKFYPVKRAFSEMEGNCQEIGNENMQLPMFGQARTNSTVPYDGSGDHTHAGQIQGQGTKKDEKNKPSIGEVQTAFQFFGAFGKSNESNAPKSPGSVFNFGDGNSLRQQTGSPNFSLFGSSNNDSNVSSGFNFGFGDNNTNRQGDPACTPGDGNFLSLFGDGSNEVQNNTNNSFSFNFDGNNRSKSPEFSFF